MNFMIIVVLFHHKNKDDYNKICTLKSKIYFSIYLSVSIVASIQRSKQSYSNQHHIKDKKGRTICKPE